VPKLTRTDQRKFSFSFRRVDRWNGMPDEIKQETNQEDFRKRLKNSDFWVPEEQRPEQRKYGIQGTPVNLLR
jgi:hypothetical protein